MGCSKGTKNRVVLWGRGCGFVDWGCGFVSWGCGFEGLGVGFCGNGMRVTGVEKLKAWGTMDSCSSKSLCPLRQDQRRGETEISLSWRDSPCQRCFAI